MGLMIQRNRKNGKPIRMWYAQFTVKGKRITRSTDVPIRGKMPVSCLVSDEGDEEYEKSRAEAKAAAKEIQESMIKGLETAPSTLAKAAYADLTGDEPSSVRVKDLLEKFKETLKGKSKATLKRQEKNTKYKEKNIADFIDWWKTTKRSVMLPAFRITEDEAIGYVQHLKRRDSRGGRFTTRTIQVKIATLAKTLDIKGVLPAGFRNPFRSIPQIEKEPGEESVSRKYLSEEECDLLVEKTKAFDPLLYDLIVTSLSTSMREGDVCRLQWKSIDLDKKWNLAGRQHTGSIKVKTEKTGEEIELPIFAGLRVILERRLTERKPKQIHVFPEALKPLEKGEITRRMKKALVNALGEHKGVFIEDAIPADSADLGKDLEDILKAIQESDLWEGKKEVYCEYVRQYAEHRSLRKMQAVYGCPRSTLSKAFHRIEGIIGKPILPRTTAKRVGMKKAVALLTRTERKIGKRSASIYDFHCLRTTFATLSFKNGVPLDYIALFTGHRCIATLRNHYCKATGRDVADLIGAALPSSLTAEPMAVAVDTPRRIGRRAVAQALPVPLKAGVPVPLKASLAAILLKLSPEAKKKIPLLPPEVKQDLMQLKTAEDFESFLALV